METFVTDATYAPMAQRPIEIVERKGIGHPDTICDSIAEGLSRELSKYYIEHFGMVETLFGEAGVRVRRV